jgi:hypothetical protein
MSDPGNFTDEPKRGDQDITGQPPRPAYDYGPDDDAPPRPPIEKAPWSAPQLTLGCLIAGVLGTFALAVLVFTVCFS